MATETTTLTASPQEQQYTKLHLASGNGPITRTILRKPLRDALPSEIPIIDVSNIFASTLAERQAVADQIHSAATTSGFFYIKNHGVPPDVIDNAYNACLDFFRQPAEIKNRANISQSKYFSGYKPPRTQRINPNESVDHRESFSWTYDPHFDPTVTTPDDIPAHIARYFRTETFHWAATRNLAHFQPSIIAYWQSCLRLARALVRSFALSLSLPETFFDSKFTYPDAALALNYYPSLDPDTTTSTDVSIGSHTDFQLFTILYQPPAIPSLQVLTRPSSTSTSTQTSTQKAAAGYQWLSASGIEGTLVVNIADYLQRITNDRYTSTVHRAVNMSGQERVSMPFFFGFGLNETCGVLDACVDEENPARYEEIGCEAWVMRRATMMHDVNAAGSKDS